MKRLLGAALFLGWAVAAQAAISWTVTKASDCTAAATPSGCCVIASPGANPACVARNTAGTLTTVRADLRSDGGTYTSGGDTLTSAALGVLGLTTIQYGNCWVSNGGEVITTSDVTGKLVKFRIWTTAGTEATGAIATSVYMVCDFYGR